MGGRLFRRFLRFARYFGVHVFHIVRRGRGLGRVITSVGVVGETGFLLVAYLGVSRSRTRHCLRGRTVSLEADGLRITGRIVEACRG